MQQYFIFFAVFRVYSLRNHSKMGCKSIFNLTFLVFFLVNQSLLAQTALKSNHLDQKSPESRPENSKISFLSNTQRNLKKHKLPYYSESQILSENGSVPTFNFRNPVIRELSSKEIEEIQEFKHLITSDFETEYTFGISRNEKIIYQKIIPIRLNNQSNKYEFLESYSPEWNFQNHNSKVSQNNFKKNAKTSAVNSSVLASGNWYKIAVTAEGVYKMDKAFLTGLGLDVNTINPQNIRIYGNGGKLMSEKNADFKYDDLQENAIVISGENDGSFDATDYVLFYGQSTDSWKHEPGSNMPFNHNIHYFSDTSFYYITVDLGAGKRVQQTSSNSAANKTTSSYDFYGFHEQNIINLVKSGREFYGEKFDFNTSYSFSYNIPNAVIGDSIYVKSGVLSRNDAPSTYLVNFNTGSFTVTCAHTQTGNYLADIGKYGSNYKGGLLSSNFLSITVSKQTTQAIGWLDNVIFNARRQLVYNQTQFNFRDRRVVGGASTFAKYTLTNNNTENPIIWDVTNPLNIKEQVYNYLGNTADFISASDSLREYCVFNHTNAFTPKAYGAIPNQNLHAIQQADYIIVTHPDYINEAYRLGQLHQTYDTLTYAIATTQQVYNEFSSGTPDIGAIREFTKMLYKRPNDRTKATKYLLLLGDGSYKNKDISTAGNSALIPTYESASSSSYTDSFVTDDFFAMMDDDEGELNNTSNDSLNPGRGDLPDIGVGRFPVKTRNEALAVTNKVEQYYKRNYSFDVNTEESMCNNNVTNYPLGDWRNWVCFVADDEDNNEHFNQANSLANGIYNTYKDYNVDKIFVDSYQQISTPGGDRFEGAVSDINHRFDRGCLIFNYTGHGGELGLGAERYVEVPQILAWKNINNMPLMVTATCEFSRFDDPDRTSAGEYCLLSSQGGAIGLMTTVRLAFSGLNFTLNQAFFTHALKPMANGKMPHIGDLYRLTKRQLGFSEQWMNFVILGDPAVRLAYPEQKVYTSTINSQTVTNTSSDTLRALSLITVTGFVGDKNGNKLSDFNGVVYPTVFDKEITLTTLANDPSSYPAGFLLQKNILYKGKSVVNNGDFSFTFLVPRDISYNFGKGKISYYAHNGIHDANGYYDKILIGGSNPNANEDVAGPSVQLYMNDERFVSGGTTNESPKVYAKVSDASGVNTIGSGIGHDIVAILDENSKNPIVLNDYYVSDLNTYQSGKIRYPFNELSEGNHTLSLKVWDVQNNSSTVFTDFIVAKEGDLALSHILNYPNPFTTKTKFFIEHNQCCTNLNVIIQIYSISGKMVKSIQKTINNEGFRFDGIEWDGKDDYGDKLAKGVYVYKVSVSAGNNKKADKIEKLVILN